MGFQERGEGWQQRREQPPKKSKSTTLNHSLRGYSPATLPSAIPRRAPARIRLPLWIVGLLLLSTLLLAVVSIVKVGQRLLRSSAIVSEPIPPVLTVDREPMSLSDAVAAVRLPADEPIVPTVTLQQSQPQLLAANWSTPILDWQDAIVSASAPYQFAPDLIASIVNIESDGFPTGVSYAGAVGLMGVMPRGSGAGLDNRPTATQLNDPTTNLTWGTKILARYLHQADGDLALALAVYNGGWGYARSVPTQTYALEVLHQTGYALATHAGVEESAVIWGIDWEICPCTGSSVTVDGVEITPTILFDDGEMRLEGVPIVAVE